MPEQIKLTVIEHQNTGNCTVIYGYKSGIVLLAGDDAEALDLCCGNCGLALVKAIHRHRFVDLNEAAFDGLKVLRLSPGAQGPIYTDEAIPVPGEAANIEAVILNCPGCHTDNATLPPN